jgi:uncharacterized lipoprotein YbaY
VQVRRPLAFIIWALTLGACGSETPTSPPAASLSSTTAVKTIGVSPTRLSFIWYARRNTLPPSQVLKISNLGSGTLAWTATSSTWLKLSSKSGTAPSSVTVWFNPSGIQPPIGYNGYRPQSLSGSIKVSATGATNTPLTVPVTLYIRYY